MALQKRVLLESDQMDKTLLRLCFQLAENYHPEYSFCIIGIQPRGVPFLEKLFAKLTSVMPLDKVQKGHLDTTFFRDDFRRREALLVPSETKMDFLVEGKDVVLVDDVLYTGRTIQAALSALGYFGRPKSVRLLCLIDRRFNREVPIKSDFIGMEVDAVDDSYIRVEWSEKSNSSGRVFLLPSKSEV